MRARGDGQRLAMIAVAGSGIAWGLFWIPLRAMDAANIPGAWTVVLFYAVPACLLFPLFFLRARRLTGGGSGLHVAGLLAGSALALYSGALVFTTVVNALLLFYLTPLWSTLLAYLVLHEPISRMRWLSLLLGFAGLLAILRLETGFAWQDSAGDWMALAAGLLWAAAAVWMRRDDNNHGVDFTLVYFVWGTVAALCLTLLPIDRGQEVPAAEDVLAVMVWLVPVVLILVIPPSFAVMWGASVLSPGIVGILFMTEISVGTVTAALWAGEPFGIREVLGIALITTAGVLEPLRELISSSVPSSDDRRHTG